MADNDFARDQACYEQNFEQARTLNAQMNQVPVLAMTLTGGLWFGAGVTSNLDAEFRFALLIFAGLCDLALILAILRIRDVFESYLEKIEKFCPSNFASGVPSKPKMPWLGSYSMISIYCTLIFVGAIFSFCGAFWKYWPFQIARWVGVGTLLASLLIAYIALFTRRKRATAQSSA
jgi:hypothetical protein